MSIKQRNGVWWVDLRTPSGERVRRSTGTSTRKAAQEYHDRLKADLWRQARLGETPQYTFEQAAVRFLREYEGRKNYATHQRHITYWRDQLAGRVIASLTTNDIKDALPTHIVRKHQARREIKPATRNRHLSTIRRMLNLCREWGWISSVPILRPEKEPKVRVRWITRDEALRLLDAISRDWMRDVVAFALATGMRAGEILKLQWENVDISRAIAWVTADKAKSGKARGVPLNAEAVQVIRQRIGTHPKLVFTCNGTARNQVDAQMFFRACERAQIKNFRFHDLRHTWASWHVQAGTPLFVLKELGGWETLEMVKKYAHMDSGTLAQYANVVTFWSHGAEKQEQQAATASITC